MMIMVVCSQNTAKVVNNFLAITFNYLLRQNTKISVKTFLGLSISTRAT